MNRKLLNTFIEFRAQVKTNLSNLLTISLLIFVFISIYFPIKIALNTSMENFSEQKSDFLIIFFYISDFILLILFLKQIINTKKLNKKLFYLWLLFIFSSLLSTVYNHLQDSKIALYYTVLVTLGYVAYETSRSLVTNNSEIIRKLFISIFIGLSIFQCIISLIQWNTQKSLGLYHVGESHISRGIDGVAKIDTPRGKYIRPYGTFPHPNILAVFLLTAWYLAFCSTKDKKNIGISLIQAIFISYTLLLTFSRTTSIIWILGLLSIILSSFIKPLHKKQYYFLVFSVFAIFTFFTINSSALKQRYSQSQPDQSLSLRTLYNKQALNFIKESPIFGIGPGQTMFQMKQNNVFNLKPYEIQPTHNYFLLFWSEFGLIPFAIVILLIYTSFLNIYRSYKINLKNNQSSQDILVYSLLLTSFIALMFIDHYFYTSRQGIILFWSSLGISSYFSLKTKEKDVSSETSQS